LDQLFLAAQPRSMNSHNRFTISIDLAHIAAPLSSDLHNVRIVPAISQSIFSLVGIASTAEVMNALPETSHMHRPPSGGVVRGIFGLAPRSDDSPNIHPCHCPSVSCLVHM